MKLSEMSQDEIKAMEKRDIDRINKKFPDVDIVDVAYDENCKIVAYGHREVPPSGKITPGIFDNIPCWGI
uniref:Uncharacterized protein n=1 Tax=viral metagenome TaxID=1070528 RepID=A0A6M3LTJ3_9ZZZZ